MLYNATNFVCNSLWSFLGAVPRKCCFGTSALPLNFIYPLSATALAHRACSWATNSTGQGTEAAGQLRGLTWNLDAAPCPLPAAEVSQASVAVWMCEEEGMLLPSFSAAGGAQPRFSGTPPRLRCCNLQLSRKCLKSWLCKQLKCHCAVLTGDQRDTGGSGKAEPPWVQREGPSSPSVSTTASKELRSWGFCWGAPPSAHFLRLVFFTEGHYQNFSIPTEHC